MRSAVPKTANPSSSQLSRPLLSDSGAGVSSLVRTSLRPWTISAPAKPALRSTELW